MDHPQEQEIPTSGHTLKKKIHPPQASNYQLAASSSSVKDVKTSMALGLTWLG